MKLNERKDEIQMRYKVIDMYGKTLQEFEYYNSAIRWAANNGITPNELTVVKL